MRATSDIATFSFRYVLPGETIFGKRDGAIGRTLTLDDTDVPWDQLLETVVR